MHAVAVFSACLFIKASLFTLSSSLTHPSAIWYLLYNVLYDSIYVKSSVWESALVVLPGRPKSGKNIIKTNTEHIDSDKK